MSRNLVRRFARRTGGASAIEFVVILPFLILLFTGLADLGLRVLEQSRLDQITREGAAAAMAGATKQEVITRMLAHQAQLGGAITGGAYGVPIVREICHCATANPPRVENCSTSPNYTALASCNGAAPWAIYLEISQTTTYRSILPLSEQEISLTSLLRVQIR